MSTVLLINCTARKTAAPSKELQARSLPRADLPRLAVEWGKRVRKAPDRMVACELYSGRSFRAIYEVCCSLGTRLAVVSAGLGVIGAEERIPTYGLTVTPGHRDSILDRCEPSDQRTPANWWLHLANQGGVRGLAAFLAGCDSDLVVIALPAPYLRMLADEISSLRKRDLARIRIVGPKSVGTLPDALREIVMPYDSRLNGPDTPLRGTEFDFPHRTAISFLRLVQRDKKLDTASNHARRVRLSLSGLRPVTRVNRKRVSDTHIREVIKKLKAKTNSMATGLKLLRTKYGIACEQMRFRKLWIGRRA